MPTARGDPLVTTVALIKILNRLARDHKKKVFSLREIAALSGESRAAAAMTLIRASKKGLIGRAGTLWWNLMDPPDLLDIALSVPIPSYLSFESALYRHGILSQSPRGALTMATAGRPRLIRTALGVIRFVHIKSSLFFGFDHQRIAFPEKAWLDLWYIRGLRGRNNLLTEEFYSDRLDPKKIKRLTKQFPKWISNQSTSGTIRKPT